MDGINANLIQKTIERIRIPFSELLSEKWWNNKKRPQKLDGNFSFIGLAVDSTSLKMFKSHGVELNAKKMYDCKNKMNALKKVVAVMTTPPHYALFSQDAFLVLFIFQMSSPPIKKTKFGRSKVEVWSYISENEDANHVIVHDNEQGDSVFDGEVVSEIEGVFDGDYDYEGLKDINEARDDEFNGELHSSK
ncbi:hypothetical protein A3Q56_07621 [Intoshia linei]|uniref:Uncharacterized protein n=1 Tax=Intoshia linei TaxID=1819745 RepID=A0A177ARM6_9BILA|nr:hypothetical protein A3Q56_07621 [Intoshia linei]